MLCPKCKSSPLFATKLDDEFLAMGCKHCGGALVSLLHYRGWVESQPTFDVPENLGAVVDVEDTTAAMGCPKCQKLMSKFRISGCTHNRLDLCTTCDEAWLDGGEWELLKSLELNQLMPKVFTEEWQRRIRKDEMEQRREERLAKLLNDEDLAKAKKMRKWLLNHTNKQDILHFVNHD